MSDVLKAREENLNAAIRRLARAAVEMEDATTGYRNCKAVYDQEVRRRMAEAESTKREESL